MSPPEPTTTLTTFADLEALQREWAALWENCPASTPFQSPQWLIPWARRWAAESLRVITVRREGALVGLAPFFVYQRTLLLLGNGVSDTLDLLAAPGCADAVAASVLATLETGAGGDWDSCDWQQLRAKSPLLTRDAPAGWSETVEPQDACPGLILPPEREFETTLSPHFFERLQADRERLKQVGEVTFERAYVEHFTLFFNDLIRLHAARWATREEPGVLGDPTVQAFHREAASGLLARGVLRLYRMLVGDRVVAVYYGFQHRDHASYYIGGFDPELGSFGVGNQIVWHALRSAQQEGARVFDFLRGREAYKYRWGATDTPAFRRRLRTTSR
jgi:CelD/BcsL family acetyltransferase involved in cellulose biosynthesis